MFCTTCGTKHDDDARFCTNCGTAVTTAQPVTKQQTSELTFEEKAKFLFDYRDEIMEDYSLAINDPDRSAKFLRFYQDVNNQKRVPEHIRIAFFLVILDCDQFVRKLGGFISADYCINEFNIVVSEQSDAAGFMEAFLKGIWNNVLIEFSQEGSNITMDECNWRKIFRHVEATACEFGLDVEEILSRPNADE